MNTESNYSVNYNLDKLMPYIKEASEILQIELPEINMVPYIIDDGINIKVVGTCSYTDNNELGYTTEKGAVHIGVYDPIKPGHFLHEAIILATIIHEFRHLWQKKYHNDEYYEHNAVGIACITDISEVDADAFAMAYMQKRTSYKESDYMKEFNKFMKMDFGARKKRFWTIRKEYFN